MKWDIDEAEACYWIAPEAAYSLTKGMKKYYGFAFKNHLASLDMDRIFKWGTLESELSDIGHKCVNKFMDKRFRKKIVSDFKNLKRSVDEHIRSIKKKDISMLSMEELFDELNIFRNFYRDNFSLGFFVEPFDFVFPEIFNNSLKNIATIEEISDLATAADISYLNVENQKLLKVALKKKAGKDILKDIFRHKVEYEWIATGHKGKKDIDVKYFSDRIDELLCDGKDIKKELEKLESFKKNLIRKRKVLIKKLKLKEEILELINIIDDVGPLHDLRKELFVKNIYYSDIFRQEIGKRTSYTLEELQNFTYEELLPLKAGKRIDRKEIADRKFYVAFEIKGAKERIYTGPTAKKLAEKEFNLDLSKIDEISGICASVGSAKGVARIIYGEKGFDKMQKGDILVTGMTRPEMMPIIKKAAAIVTDEGGITCHAAIVARELGIPCIIGTKIATKILKDEDFIEVNANIGWVRIVK